MTFVSSLCLLKTEPLQTISTSSLRAELGLELGVSLLLEVLGAAWGLGTWTWEPFLDHQALCGRRGVTTCAILISVVLSQSVGNAEQQQCKIYCGVELKWTALQHYINLKERVQIKGIHIYQFAHVVLTEGCIDCL